VVEISRSGKPAQAGTNRHRGHDHTDECAARRVSPLLGATREGPCVMRSEKEGGHGHRPCEETRVPDLSPVRRKQLQKSAGSILASNKLARSAPKRVAVRVNGGLGGAVSEKRHASVLFLRGGRRSNGWSGGVGLCRN